jgi:hypothetical protein
LVVSLLSFDAFSLKGKEETTQSNRKSGEQCQTNDRRALRLRIPLRGNFHFKQDIASCNKSFIYVVFCLVGLFLGGAVGVRN